MSNIPRQPERCPHGANPAACPLCFQMRSKMKKPAPARASLEPEIHQGNVVKVDANNPAAQALLARKAAAIEASMGKLPVTGPLQTMGPAQGASRPAPGVSSGVQTQASNPHDGTRRRGAKAQQASESQESEDHDLTPQDIAALEQLYPKRKSIIDHQSTHPDATVRGSGSGNSGRSRAPVTRGRKVSG